MGKQFAGRTAELASALAAILIGFAGVGWGLPNATRLFPLHPDEALNLFAAQGVNPLSGNFLPKFYNYGTLYLDLTRLTADLSEALGLSPYFLPRVLNLIAFSICAGLAAVIARRSGGVIAAWVAGSAVVLAPGLVVHSRFATVDVLAVGFVMAALAAFTGSPSLRRLMVGVAFAAMAAACKYNCGLVLLAAGPMLFTFPVERRITTGGGAILLFLGLFVALVPGVVLAPTDFRRDVAYELLHTGKGHGLIFAATSPGFFFQIGNLALALGILPLLTGATGLTLSALRRERWAIALLLLVIPYFVLIGRAEVKFLRYCLPLIPPLACGFGVLVARLAERPERQRFACAGAVLALGLDPTGGLRSTLIYTMAMAGPDPRDVAGAYLRQTAPEVGLATDPWFWSPSIYPEIAAPRFLGPKQIFGWMASATQPRVIRYLPEGQLQGRKDFDLRLLRESRPAFVATTTLEIGTAERLARITTPLPAEATAYRAEYIAFNEELQRDYRLERTFGDLHWPVIEDLEYVRPSVYVWKRIAP